MEVYFVGEFRWDTSATFMHHKNLSEPGRWYGKLGGTGIMRMGIAKQVYLFYSANHSTTVEYASSRTHQHPKYYNSQVQNFCLYVLRCLSIFQ